jgi:NAD(P)-dependent dehydrogenase (short-subunit alcohol dehydrogenase family)
LLTKSTAVQYGPGNIRCNSVQLGASGIHWYPDDPVFPRPARRSRVGPGTGRAEPPWDGG